MEFDIYMLKNLLSNKITQYCIVTVGFTQITKCAIQSNNLIKNTLNYQRLKLNYWSRIYKHAKFQDTHIITKKKNHYPLTVIPTRDGDFSYFSSKILKIKNVRPIRCRNIPTTQIHPFNGCILIPCAFLFQKKIICVLQYLSDVSRHQNSSIFSLHFV